MKSDLDTRVKAIKAQMVDHHVGPLRVAEEVVAILDHWDLYRAQAGDLDADAWAEKTFGKRHSAAEHRRRVKAIEELVRLGYQRATILSRFDHFVAVYVTGQSIPPPQRKAVVNAILQEQKERGCLLPYAIARQVAGEVTGRVSLRSGQAHKLRIAMAHIAHLREAYAEGKPLPPWPISLRPLAFDLQSERIATIRNGPSNANEGPASDARESRRRRP